MRPALLATAVAAIISQASCTLANMTPQARFQDSAFTLNDAARWGQVDLAVVHVSAKYRARFVERHREWGETVSIAEVELLRMQIAEDKKSAMSEVSLSWYDTNGVTLRTSVVTQQWETERGKFRLVDEAIRRGDARLFKEPEEAQSQGS